MLMALSMQSASGAWPVPSSGRHTVSSPTLRLWPRRTPLAPAPAASTTPSSSSGPPGAWVRQQHEPEQHAEHLALACRHHLLDGDARDVVRAERAGIAATPCAELRACRIEFAGAQQACDALGIVAKIFEAQCDIQNAHIPHPPEKRADAAEQKENQPYAYQHRHDCQRPGDRTVAVFTGVELALEPLDEQGVALVMRLRLPQRAYVLEHDGSED